MSKLNTCDFCDRKELAWRAIRSEDLFTSFVSKPWFRTGHCLVIPNRHVVSVDELNVEESSAVMSELGRLSKALDEGYGSGIMQKYQPKQSENGIKINHLHFHVFPRYEKEDGLFPVPNPNDFEGFTVAADNEISELALRLR